jgi:rhodanese-related sulfurtransferase
MLVREWSLPWDMFQQWLTLPLSEFGSGYQALDKDKTYHIICQSGARSEQACFFLDDQGYKVVNVDGGTSAWPGVLEY